MVYALESRLTPTAESNYNYDDEDDEDDGDYDGNDYESGSTRQDHLFEPGLLGPSVNLNVPDTPSSLRNMPNSQPGKVETPTQRQAQRQQRKRQKRTQQDTPGQRRHAAVEKRYRSVINSKIQQLNDLVPPSTAEPRPASGKAPTKAVVMDRALRHIDTLVSTYGEYEKERNELRQKLETWLDDFDTIGADKTMDT
ncbi:hypothetical protein ACHAPU_008453 [Fusarium lateritium]